MEWRSANQIKTSNKLFACKVVIAVTIAKEIACTPRIAEQTERYGKHDRA